MRARVSIGEMAERVRRVPGSLHEQHQAGVLRSLLPRDEGMGSRVACIVARTGGRQGVGLCLKGV